MKKNNQKSTSVCFHPYLLSPINRNYTILNLIFKHTWSYSNKFAYIYNAHNFTIIYAIRVKIPNSWPETFVYLSFQYLHFINSTLPQSLHPFQFFNISCENYFGLIPLYCYFFISLLWINKYLCFIYSDQKESRWYSWQLQTQCKGHVIATRLLQDIKARKKSQP